MIPSRVEAAIDEGYYFEALGVAGDATKLQIDVAAAQLARQQPCLGAPISAVARTLIHRERRAVYEHACQLRDRVLRKLAEDYGADFVAYLGSPQPWVWQECCALMRFQLRDTNLEVGPAGAKSLIEPGESWVTEVVLERHALVIPCEDDDWPGDSITCELWHAACPTCGNRRLVACRRQVGPRRTGGHSEHGRDAEEPKSFKPREYVYRPRPCPNCRSGGTLPHHYDDLYTFTILGDCKSQRRGTAVRGVGARDGRVVFGLLNGAATAPRPLGALYDFYRAQQEGEDVELVLPAMEAVTGDDRRQQQAAGTLTVRSLQPTTPAGNTVGAWVVWLLAVGFVVLMRACPSGRDAPSSRAYRPPPVRLERFGPPALPAGTNHLPARRPSLTEGRELPVVLPAKDETALKPLVGRQLPELDLVDLDGNPVSTTALAGRQVLIQFWFCCPHGQEDLERLEEAYDRYQDDSRLAILLVNTNSPKMASPEIREFLDQWNVHLPVLRITPATATVFKFRSCVAVRLLLDERGRVRGCAQGRKLPDPSKWLDQSLTSPASPALPPSEMDENLQVER